MCNGHADTCDNRDPNDPTILLCRCQHNTCGPKCDRCCPGYEQKAWRQSKSYSPFSCERTLEVISPFLPQILSVLFQLATAFCTRENACTTRKRIANAYLWTSTGNTRAAASVRIANITPKASTVTGARRRSTDPTRNIGTKLTFVNVSKA